MEGSQNYISSEMFQVLLSSWFGIWDQASTERKGKGPSLPWVLEHFDALVPLWFLFSADCLRNHFHQDSAWMLIATLFSFMFDEPISLLFATLRRTNDQYNRKRISVQRSVLDKNPYSPTLSFFQKYSSSGKLNSPKSSRVCSVSTVQYVEKY